MQDISLEQLLEAGCHFGHQRRRWNPAMKGYIYGERDGVHIFDLVKTRDGLMAACKFVKEVAARGGKILFVGTKKQAAEFVKAEAVRVGMPYVSVRWMGGLLTNNSYLSGRIRKMADMKKQREAGEFKKYTKKERLLLDREITKLEKFFGGVSDMVGLPDAVFVVDTHKEDVAVREACKMGVPLIGVVDTNAEPSMEYVIPANDDAVKSIELIVKAVADAIEDGRKTPVEPKAEADATMKEVKAEVKSEEKAEKPKRKTTKKEAK